MPRTSFRTRSSAPTRPSTVRRSSPAGLAPHILRNTSLNRVAKRAVDVAPRSEAARDAVDRTPSSDAGPEERTVERTFAAVVARELGALSAGMRAVIELVDMDGLSYQEAADELGVPVGTVMSRLHRARRRMRDSLVAAGVTAHGRRS